AKVSVGLDKSNSDRFQVQSALSNGIGNAPGQGQGHYGNVETKGELLDITLNYNKDFGDSQLTALVGYSFQSYQRKGKTISALGFSTTRLSQMIADMEQRLLPRNGNCRAPISNLDITAPIPLSTVFS